MIEPRNTCHDCGVLEGQIHHLGCDMERCPFCGSQLISCKCCYLLLDLFDQKQYTKDTYYLPPEIYEHGLSDEQQSRWLELLQAEGRIPYILYPNLCYKCGVLWPDMFYVPDEEWNKYVAPADRGAMLCRPCYDQIRAWIDESAICQAA